MKDSVEKLQRSLEKIQENPSQEDKPSKGKIRKIGGFLMGKKKKSKEDIQEDIIKKINHYTQKLADTHEKKIFNPLLKRYYRFSLQCAYYEKKYYEIYDFVRSALWALSIALVVRSCLYQPFNIPSESMLPNLVVGDYIFVNKFHYGFSRYSFPFALPLFSGRVFSAPAQRGDVVVFRVVEDHNKDYIKRVIGVAGDRIQYINSRLWVNGEPVPASFMGNYTGQRPMDLTAENAALIQENLYGTSYNTLDIYQNDILDNTIEFIVPKNHYFVSGDNRDRSQDSRAVLGPVGFVHEDRLLGKASVIFFSLDRASFLEFWKWPTAIRFERIFQEIK